MSVFSKALRVLGHAELFEPVRDLLHCGAPSHSPSGEHIRLRGCRPFRLRSVLRAGMARIALGEFASVSFAIRLPPASLRRAHRRPRLSQGEA